MSPAPPLSTLRPDATGEEERTAAAPPGRRSRAHTVALAAISAGIVLAFTLYAALMAARVDEIASPQPITVPGSMGAPRGVGQPAPDFPLTALDGQPGRLSDYAGRPVWINVWASWCAPCRAEMPDIHAVYQEERSKELLAASARDGGSGDETGLALLLVSIGEDASVVRRYAATTRVIELPVFVDPSYTIAEQYRINGLPTHYFIGRDGAIRDLAIGGLKPGAMRQRLAKILRD